MTVPSALPFYLAPAPLATGQEVGPEQHGSQAGASWQLAHNLEVWTWSLVPREQLSVWHFRSSCHLNRLLLVVIRRVRILPRFLGRQTVRLSSYGWMLLGGGSPGKGRERRVLLWPVEAGWEPRPWSRELGSGIPEPLQLLLSLLCIGSQPCLRAL